MDNHFYDLSNKNEILWQTELARKYGIDGFVIYQYYSCNNSKYGKEWQIGLYVIKCTY